MPTRNIWPTRWASLIRDMTCATQEAPAGAADAADAEEGAAGRSRADPGLTTLAEYCGPLLPGPRPHPEQINPSATTPASSARAGRRRFRPPSLPVLPSPFRT
jgi:hypothetical protein